MIYTVTFNPALDYVVRLPAFEPGAVNRTESEDIQLGGKGINVSCVLGQLGFKSVALGFVAGFTGEAVETLMPLPPSWMSSLSVVHRPRLKGRQAHHIVQRQKVTV